MILIWYLIDKIIERRNKRYADYIDRKVKLKHRFIGDIGIKINNRLTKY